MNNASENKTHSTHGETSWDESGGGGGGKLEFIRLSQGESTMRIITLPHKHAVHKNVRVEGEAKGREFPCSKENGSCVLCDAGLPVKTKYMLGVIDRSTNTAKVIDIGWGIYSVIKGYANGKIWKDPQTWDLSISRNPASTGPNDYYTVQPIPHTPLSITDQQIKDSFNLEFLRNRTQPAKPEFVADLFNKYAKGREIVLTKDDEKTETKSKTKSNGKKGTAVPPTELVDSGNLDDDFPLAMSDQPAN
jgi:hypothetical protein